MGGGNHDMVDRKLLYNDVNTSVLGMIAKGSDMNVNLTFFQRSGEVTVLS